jgi:hypothetical protein
VPLPLDGSWAKVERAVEHLRALDLGCKIFLETKPYYLAAEFEPEAERYALLLRVRAPVPIALSVIVGDFLHNLRSALDQAAWVLACRSTPAADLWASKVARSISWPFVDDPTKLESHGLGCRVADDARAVLDRAQPYQQTPRTRALGRLNDLWNVDKHRVVHGGWSQIDLSGVRYVSRAIDFGQFPSREEFPWPPNRAPEDRTLLSYIYFEPPPGGMPPTAEVDVKGEPKAQVVFGAGGGEIGSTIDELAQLADHVAATLSEVAGLPDEPPDTGRRRRA